MPRPERDWSLARNKILQAEVCRVPTCRGRNLDAAHVIGRTHDYTAPLIPAYTGSAIWRPGVVWPDRIIPLCSGHHRAQHAGTLDILPLLTIYEQAQAVADAGGIERARAQLARAANRRRVLRRDPDLLGGM